MRLRTGLIGLLFVVGVVLSGTIYLGFALHKDDVVAQERQQVQTVADVVATDVESQLEERRGAAVLWANAEGVADHRSQSQRDALRTYVQQTDFGGASIVDSDGEIAAIRSTTLTRSAERDLVGRTLADRQYVERALEGSTYVSDPFEAESGTRIVAISTPVRRGGRVVGVLTGALYLPAGSLFDNAARLGQSSQRVRVTADEQTIFGSIPRTIEDPITANATVAGTGWTVTAYGDRNGLTARLQQATGAQLGGVFLALLCLVAIGVWVSRTTIAQLDELVDGFDALERGEYGQDLRLTASDEWRTIGDRYNALGDTLRQRDSQLQVLNRVLRHNLRNDMNVITAHAESVLADEETRSETADHVEQIHATARRLIDTSDHARALYEDLLSGGRRDPSPVDAAGVVTRQVETLRAEFPACSIETEFPDSARALDTSVLPVVVEEVLHNAIVHNDRPESERRIVVGVGTDRDSDLGPDGEVRITITDNGPGIPMIEEALLTDELEETPIEHGSGLGVWLVNWLVDQLGGTVEAHSGVDQGTTVTIRVPAAPNEA